jgi:ATP-dependent helicase/nuclease subunit A
MARNWTAEQQAAIRTMGKGLLVSAAAGSGKTSVLAERCAYLVCDAQPRCNVNQLLVVTFTELAAAEMRTRIEQAIRTRALASPDDHLRKQLRLVDHAAISTLHSFCMQLLRRHFHRIELDPDFEVIDEDEALLMRDEVVRQLFADRHEDGDGDFERFLDAYGGGNDDMIMRLVVSTHELLCSLVRPEDWLKTSLQRIEQASKLPLKESAFGRYYLRWTAQRLRSIIDECDAAIQAMPPGFEKYVGYVQELAGTAADWLGLLESHGYDAVAETVRSFECPRCPSMRGDTPDKDLASTLVKRAQSAIKDDALVGNLRFTEAEWQRTMAATHAHADAFLKLVDDFSRRYTQAKQNARGLDFSDLERLALTLLCEDRTTLAPSDVARACHRAYRHVLVDEYQDINQVQDAILRLVSRECLCRDAADASNLFCVGDVKQSIYRFRLAEPRRFLDREELYRKAGAYGGAQVIDLRANFRSRKPLLDAINAVFERLMYKQAAEIDYDERHRLVAGADYADGDGSATFRGAPIELHLLPPPNKEGEDGAPAPADHTDLDRSDVEALLIVRRIRQMMGLTPGTTRMQVMQRTDAGFIPRPIEYGDCVILLRSLQHKADQFASILRRYGIPVHCDGGAGFFDSIEVRDILALLQVLDNQQQDLPLAALLRSPLAMLPMATDALARIRLAYNDPQAPVPFHQAVVRYAQEHEDPLAHRLRALLAQLAAWRDAATKRPLAELIWTIYDETGYLAYTAGLEDGEQRQANLLHLHERARQFGTFRRQSLYRFLRFLDSLQAQREVGQPSLASQAENAVRIMSIHRSKGLEFPIVFLPDLGKRINFNDIQRHILVDREAQLGLRVIDSEKKVIYPSLAHAVVKDRIHRSLMAEELRLLYVAMTRAKEHLVLIGTCDAKTPQTWQTRWAGHGGVLPASSVVGAMCMLDWLGAVSVAAAEFRPIEQTTYDTAQVAELMAMPREARAKDELHAELTALRPLTPPPATDAAADAVIERVGFEYPHRDHCLRRAAVAATEWTALQEPSPHTAPVPAPPREGVATPSLLRLPRCVAGTETTATDRGTATHLVLQHLDFAVPPFEAAIGAQVEAMVARRLLAPAQAELVDIASIRWFLESELGEQLRARHQDLVREQPFYLASDHPGCTSDNPLDRLMVRGRIDLMLVEPDGCSIIDYKTDRVDETTLPQRREHYATQVGLYRRALEAATTQPVKAIHLVFLAARQIVGM